MPPEFTFRPPTFVSDLYPTNLQVPGLSGGGRGGAGLVSILSVKGLTIYHIPPTKLQSIHSRSSFPPLKEEEKEIIIIILLLLLLLLRKRKIISN